MRRITPILGSPKWLPLVEDKQDYFKSDRMFAPKQAELQEWLRDNNIEVEVHRYNFGYDVDVCDWRGVYCDCSYSREDLGSYEEALEEGLYRALLMLA